MNLPANPVTTLDWRRPTTSQYPGAGRYVDESGRYEIVAGYTSVTVGASLARPARWYGSIDGKELVEARLLEEVKAALAEIAATDSTVTLFWRNRIDRVHEVSTVAIAAAFWTYDGDFAEKREELREIRPFEVVVRAFLTLPETDGGLNSSIDENDDTFARILRSVGAIRRFVEGRA